MKILILLFALILCSSCSNKTSAPAKSKERIILHDPDKLQDQIHQKNEKFEIERPKQIEDKPAVGPDTEPDPN